MKPSLENRNQDLGIESKFESKQADLFGKKEIKVDQNQKLFEMNKNKLEQAVNYDLTKPEEGYSYLQAFSTSYTPEQMEQAKMQNKMFNSVLKNYPKINQEKLKQIFLSNQKELLNWMTMAGKNNITDSDIKKLDIFVKNFGTEIYPLVKDSTPSTNINANKNWEQSGEDMNKYANKQEVEAKIEIAKQYAYLNNFSGSFIKELADYGATGNNVYKKYIAYKAKQQGGYSQYNN